MPINYIPSGGGAGGFEDSFRFIDGDITLEESGQIIIFDPQPLDNSNITITFDITDKEVGDAVIISNTASPNAIAFTFNNEGTVLGFSGDPAASGLGPLATTMLIFDGSNWVRIESEGFTSVTENA